MIAYVLSSWVVIVLATSASAEQNFEVMIETPSSLEAVFGTVEVTARIFTPEGESVVELVLFVDGVRQRRLVKPPWRMTLDVGNENRQHEFRLVARGSAGSEAESSLRTPAIRVHDEVAVELQQLYVTVADGRGRRILDLEAKDFQVVDDGRPQSLMTFARGEVAITAALLIDSSESMRGRRLSAALEGARAFIDGMQPRDEGMLALFADQLLRATEFTSDHERLLTALEDVRASGDTAVNDHVYMGLQMLDGRQGRRVLVLFTDGADLNSVLDMEEVLWKARRSRALIYWLRLDAGGRGSTSFATAWRDAASNRQQLELLEKSVRLSGGRIEVIRSLDHIESAFRGIISELREQYVLGFHPEEIRNDGAWHEVDVKVRRPGVRVRSRDGYVDE